jgi:hypothetical protein
MADNRFTLIFISALTLTAACGLAMGAIALFGPPYPHPPVAALLETLKLGFSGGMIAVFGLLGSPPVARSSRVRSRRR